MTLFTLIIALFNRTDDILHKGRYKIHRLKKTPADEKRCIHRGEPKGEVYNVW